MPEDHVVKEMEKIFPIYGLRVLSQFRKICKIERFAKVFLFR